MQSYYSIIDYILYTVYYIPDWDLLLLSLEAWPLPLLTDFPIPLSSDNQQFVLCVYESVLLVFLDSTYKEDHMVF